MISVVVTCYNYGKYLRGCLESVLAQTWSDLEVVVVNDGSVDETDQVMASFAAHGRVRYIKQGNLGQAAAKNAGIEAARGEFVAFLDADDLWLPDKLAKQMERFSSERVGVVYSLARFIDENGAPFEHEVAGRYLKPRRGRVTEQLVFDNFVPFSSSVVRRACLERAGGFDATFKMGIDWDLWLRLSTEYDFDFVEEQLLCYRMGHGGQMSRNMAERHRCSDAIMAKFLALHPDAVSEEVLSRARSYSYCNRGYYFRGVDRRKALDYYLRAIRNRPADLTPYQGILLLMVGR